MTSLQNVMTRLSSYSNQAIFCEKQFYLLIIY